MNITKEDMERKGIEVVTVNGMQMFKRGDRLFLTVEHAYYPIDTCKPDGKYEMKSNCKSVPYKYNDNIFEKIAKGEILVALVKF